MRNNFFNKLNCKFEIYKNIYFLDEDKRKNNAYKFRLDVMVNNYHELYKELLGE